MRSSFTFAILLAGAFVPSLAIAACPGSYAGAACNGGTGNAVCTSTASSFSCDLEATSPATQGGELFAFNTSNTAVRAFGTDGQGELFCCEFTGLNDGCGAGANPLTDTFYGTDYVDTMKLQFGTDDLKCANATLSADSSADDIWGSRTNTSTYNETLYGDGNNDTINGAAGDDTIWGGAGDDTIWAGDGDDTVNGEGGLDRIKGDNGDDLLYGGGDADEICGGNDDDIIIGNDGDDVLFSGVGDNTIQTVDGGLGTDDCGHASYVFSFTSCATTTITVCPW